MWIFLPSSERLGRLTMNHLAQTSSRSATPRSSMVIIFAFFGYQKWFDYEAQVLIPYISNGPLISWMYPVFGIRGASWFLGVSEWLFGLLLFLGTLRASARSNARDSPALWPS